MVGVEMNEGRRELLLSLLGERLHLGQPSREQAGKLFNSAYEYLERQRGSSPSLLGQEQGCAEDVWGPCIVWLLKSIPGLLSRTQEKAGAQAASPACLPLSELLDACGISLVSFFKELPVVLNKLKPWLSEMSENADKAENVLRLREWQETLVSLTQLANKYKDLFWHVQRSSGSSASKQPLLRAGWLAFLVIKAQLLPGFPDLVSCLELLVCVLNMVLANSTFSERQLQELQEQFPSAIELDGRFSMLKALSQEAKVDCAHTQRLMPEIEMRFRAHLDGAAFSWLPQPLPAQLPHPQSKQLDTSCSFFLEGMLSNQQQLSELVLSLDGAYQAWYSQQGEIDERDFLLNDFGGLASPRTLPGAAIHMPASALGAHSTSLDSKAVSLKAGPVNGSSQTAPKAASAARDRTADTAMAVEQEELSPLAALAAAAASQQQRPQPQQQHVQKPPLVPGSLARKAGLMLHGLQSPLPMMNLGPPGPATPISQAMGSVSWLRSLVRGLSLEPSANMQRYMQAAGAEAGPVLVERVKAAAAAVFLSDAAGEPVVGGLQGLQHGLAQERQAEGIKLYWHVLEAMLTAEEARAGLLAAGALLTRWPFHQCLLACAFEVVAASYRMGLLSFPTIPAKLGLKPFDLSKMIGPFVKAEPTLPRELKRHMFTVEEKILESLGWAPGSSFYRLIRAATGQVQHQQQHLRTAVAAATSARSASIAEAADQQCGLAGEDDHMQDAGHEQGAEGLPTSEQQQELQQEAAAAAAVDAEQPYEDVTPSAAAAEARRRAGPLQGLKRGSDTGSAEAMDTDAASRSSASPSLLTVAAKRQRGQDGRATDSPRNSPAFVVPEEELPLPKALGLPPGISNAYCIAAAGTAAQPAAGDPSACAVLHDYCRKVLKLAAFRLVAVSEGLDFSPMTRDEVVSQVHDLLTAALYQHTSLFYSRHLDTLLLACLYGWCKVNRLNQITFREIIAHYKRQAHAKQEVFRTVVLQHTDPQLVTQATGDIIAFYNAVFVPAMKGVLLTISHQQHAAGDAAATLGTSQAPTGAATDAAGVRPSPMQTAMQLAATTQQQQQRRAPSTVVSPGSTGSAYRALSLPGAATAGAAGSSLCLAGFNGSSNGTLLGGMGGSYSGQPAGAAGSSGYHQAGGAGSGGGFRPGADGSFAPAAADMAAPAVAAAAAAAPGAGGSAPSRLSRLSRPGPPGPAAAAAMVVEAVDLPGGLVPHPKAAAVGPQAHGAQHASAAGRHAGVVDALAAAAAAAAAADAVPQPDQIRARVVLSDDQGPGPRSGAAGSESEPFSPSADGASAEPCASSGADQPSSCSPQGSLLSAQQQQQRVQQVRPGAPGAGMSPAAATASGSPSAGLATLLQALDTKSAGAGAAGQAGGQELMSSLMSNGTAVMSHPGSQAGHLPTSCGQQQAAVMMDL